MKIGIIGDLHWCQYSSIVRKRGEKYSLRLENCIKSVNWAEELTSQLGCEFNVYMGDFFDRADLNSEEISALKEIKWNDLDKYFLVGNHEMGSANLQINSINLFELFDNYLFNSNHVKPFYVIDKEYSMAIKNLDILFLPYILENNRKSLIEYINNKSSNRSILLMHNDIKGIQLGKIKSTQGFDIEEIENNFDLCINGHLHNGGKISDGIINVGNLTGQNFSEDAHRYDHVIFILDTDTLNIDVYENPYAFNFYKEDWVNGIPYNNIFKNNAVITVQTVDENYEDVKQFINNNKNIIESRILIKPTIEENRDINYEDLSIDHYKEFEKYILSHIDASEITKEEIAYILQ